MHFVGELPSKVLVSRKYDSKTVIMMNCHVLNILKLLYIWYIFGGIIPCHFHFCFPSMQVSTLKGKNLLLQEQILSYKSRPDFRGTSSSRKTKEVMKVVPLCKNGRNMEMYPYPLTWTGS